MEFLTFNFKDVLSAFFVLFAVIDVPGLMPIIINYKRQGNPINATKASLYSLAAFVTFLFVGEALLNLFNVDIASFAVAGSLVIFALAFEMIFGIKIFKTDDTPKSSSVFVPIVFPLIAGAGSFTTLLSLRALYSTQDILVSLIANVIVIFLAIRLVSFFEKVLGEGGIYVLQRVFGIILLAISVRMFMENITQMLDKL
ncbi:MAG: MarC family protein [Bacteroidales bacterium]|nr:MarC family protein [Bacteroidales bacterium]MBR4119834.1 MarC family protein [Bacteroidales bacterium]